MQRSNNKKQKNKWFWLFWILILIIVGLCVGGLTLAMQSNTISTTTKSVNQNDNTFDVVLNKQQINALTKNYTKEIEQKSGREFGFVVNDYANLYGKINVLGQALNVGMSLTPKVTSDGNILLKPYKITVGELQLPTSIVLGLFSKTYDVPSWMIINPRKNQILIDLSKIKTSTGIMFKAKSINMMDNKFVFEGRIN